MAILTDEFEWLASALVNFSIPAQNGGRPTETEIASGVKNALFPDISTAQREAGVELWRKAFVAIRNADDLPLVDPKISVESVTADGGYVLVYPGTMDDTEDLVVARPYGYGVLAADGAVDDVSITVTAEHADYETMNPNAFQVGDKIRIDARGTIEHSGDHEYRTISSVSYSGQTLTLGIDALEHAYTAAGGVHVASVIEPGDIEAGYSSLSVTGGVTFDDTGHPPTVPWIGGLYETWTVTVTDADTGALSVSGDTLGVVGTGATGADLAPVNPNGGTYFVLPAGGWGGTPADGDTLEFTTSPAMTGVWYQMIVPAGTGPIAADGVVLCVEGES